jgi:hypothetical protein
VKPGRNAGEGLGDGDEPERRSGPNGGGERTATDRRTGSERIDRLLTEVETAPGEAAPGDEPSRSSARQTREAVAETLSVGQFRFDEGLVKENLEETLLFLIASRQSGSHGKQLMDDLASTFDAHLSPGTVYPALHDLHDGGLLERYENVRTKRYDIAKPGSVGERLGDAARQHLLLGAMLLAAVDEL